MRGCNYGGISKTEVLKMIEESNEEIFGDKGLNVITDRISSLSDV